MSVFGAAARENWAESDLEGRGELIKENSDIVMDEIRKNGRIISI
jgi:hypothetical protein